MMEQRSLSFWFSGGSMLRSAWRKAFGTGSVMVMGRWNLRRRGSIVTIGENAKRDASVRPTRESMHSYSKCTCTTTLQYSALGTPLVSQWM